MNTDNSITIEQLFNDEKFEGILKSSTWKVCSYPSIDKETGEEYYRCFFSIMYNKEPKQVFTSKFLSKIIKDGDKIDKKLRVNYDEEYGNYFSFKKTVLISKEDALKELIG